jgi:hypothetical protein
MGPYNTDSGNHYIYNHDSGISLQFAKSQTANQAKPGRSDKSPTVNCEYKMFSLTTNILRVLKQICVRISNKEKALPDTSLV